MNPDLKQQLFNHILAADRQAANELIDQWATKNNYEKSIGELLEPALEKFGDIWATSDDVSLAQGYIAGKIAEDIMKKAAGEKSPDREAPESKGPIVMGNIEDDYHALGRKLVVTFLQTAGWQVFDLGNDVLAEEFVDKALEVKAKVVGASAMMYTNAVNIKKLRREIDRRGLTGKLQLAVGGAVFLLRKDLIKEVGGDGTARNALEVPALMEKLWKRAESLEDYHE